MISIFMLTTAKMPHHTLFISSFDHILPILHLIWNNSLREGSLTDCEKLAFITTILKKPGLDPDAASNYRPISNLTFVSKLIEPLVCYQLTNYLTDNQLFAPVQSAYWQHHSTKTATLKVASDVFDAIDNG